MSFYRTKRVTKDKVVTFRAGPDDLAMIETIKQAIEKEGRYWAKKTSNGDAIREALKMYSRQIADQQEQESQG